jgi:hypothetical protein
METIEIGKIDSWSVLVKPWPNHTDTSLWWDVRVKHKDAKGAYWLNWNGKRFANGKAFHDFERKNPDLAVRVYETLQAWNGKQTEGGHEDGRASG